MKYSRGVSAVVAVVLIIMITVAAVAIIWAFIIPTIKNSLEDSTSEKATLTIETAGGYTTWDEVQKIARVQVKRGNDKLNLTGIDFSFIKQGNTKKNQTDKVPNPGTTKIYEFNLSDFGKPEEIKVAPITSKGVGAVSATTTTSYIGDYSGPRYCNFTYNNDWSVCNSSGMRNRTLNSSSPFGCVGTPVLVESCDYVFSTVIEINSCEDLQNMSANLTANYALGQDIDCSKTNPSIGGSIWGSEGFLPIGNSRSSRFEGSLEGNNFQISNLFINTSQDYVGLFGLTRNSNISNLRLVNVNIISLDPPLSTPHAGGLAGYCFLSSIENVSVTGTFEGISFVGGIAGLILETNLTSSFSEVYINARQSVGGLAGVVQDSKIRNTYSIVEIDTNIPSGYYYSLSSVAGLIGDLDNSEVFNSYVSGNIIVDSSDWPSASGFVDRFYESNISNSFSNVSIVGGDISSFGAFVSSGVVWSNGVIDNSYWYDLGLLNPSFCYPDGEQSEGCIKIQSQPDYFYSSSNEPMKSWNFVNVWQENVGDYPTLKSS